jgi:hypothetical protein
MERIQPKIENKRPNKTKTILWPYCISLNETPGPDLPLFKRTNLAVANLQLEIGIVREWKILDLELQITDIA